MVCHLKSKNCEKTKMKILIIGGTGHVGSYLTSFLVQKGHEVVVMTSGRRPIPESGAWESVCPVIASYRRGGGDWQTAVADLEADVIIDILGTDVPLLYEMSRLHCQHLIVCGSIWMFGPPRTVPTPEATQGPCIFEPYAQRYHELVITRNRALEEGIAFTAVMPPNICGPGKIPLDTMGGRSPDVHRALARGEEVVLPFPCSNLISPCDAEDIATAFVLAVESRDAAAGKIFNVGSAYGLTALQFVEVYGAIYGVDLPVRFVDWKTYTTISPSRASYYHFEANMCPDITEIKEKLGYRPDYTPEQSMERAVNWMRGEGIFDQG